MTVPPSTNAHPSARNALCRPRQGKIDNTVSRAHVIGTAHGPFSADRHDLSSDRRYAWSAYESPPLKVWAPWSPIMRRPPFGTEPPRTLVGRSAGRLGHPVS